MAIWMTRGFAFVPAMKPGSPGSGGPGGGALAFGDVGEGAGASLGTGVAPEGDGDVDGVASGAPLGFVDDDADADDEGVGECAWAAALDAGAYVQDGAVAAVQAASVRESAIAASRKP